MNTEGLRDNDCVRGGGGGVEGEGDRGGLLTRYISKSSPVHMNDHTQSNMMFHMLLLNRVYKFVN